MNRIVLTTVFFLLLITGISAQTEQEYRATVDKQKAEIKQAINSYRKVVRFKDTISYKYVYLKDKELKMVNIWVNKDGIDKNVEWYFVNGKMVYCEQVWRDVKTKKIVDHKQYYLKDEKIYIAIDTDGKKMDENLQEFKDASAGIPKYAEHLREEASHL